MHQAIRALGVGDTPLGASIAWPPHLKTSVDLALAMPQPACVCWGPEARLLYNDAYRNLLGHRHPAALAAPLTCVWNEVSEQIRPRIASVLEGAPCTWDDAPYALATGDAAPVSAWFTATWTPIVSNDGAVDGFLIIAMDTTARHQAEVEKRVERDERAFLLELSDAIRPLADAGEIQSVAARALGLRLGADRVGYAEDLDGETIVVTRNYVRDVPSIEGSYRYDHYGQDLLGSFQRGRNVVRRDVANDETLTTIEKAAHSALQLGAAANIPLLKNGVLRAVLFVHFQAPHDFTDGEIALMSEVAERTWVEVMRARAEQETQRSEERYRTLFSSMDEGYCIIQMLYDDQGRPDDFRYVEVNPAFEAHNGLKGAVGRTIREMAPKIERKWIEIYNRVAETGESLRFQEVSGALQDRTFDLYAFRVGEPEERKVAVLFTNITEAKRLADRQAILLAELQHRVRNTLAMIRTISDRTIRAAPSLEAFATAWRGRLETLSRVQALLTRTANLGVALADIVQEELAAQADSPDQYSVGGPGVVLPPKAAEVLTLAVHELATNALKYGALSAPSGRVVVTWDLETRQDQPWLTFEWREELGAVRLPLSPQRKGFGRELIEQRVPYDLHGHSELTLTAVGARCRLSFPLQRSASVLETGVPDDETIFDVQAAEGRNLTMDLDGQHVLVLEDDFLLADEIARLLTWAGASVLGPFSTESAAVAALGKDRATLAVLDVNLGDGPSFDLAWALKGRAIPFFFLTGYDDAVFPPDLQDVHRVKKPASAREILAAIIRLNAD